MTEPAFHRPVPAFLLGMLDGYEQVFRAYFGLDLEFPPDPEKKDPNQNRFLNSLAGPLFRDAARLVAGQELHGLVEHLSGTFPARDLAKFLADQVVISRQLELDLARQDLQRLPERTRRVHQLLALLSNREPSMRAGDYLQQVAVCFLAGLDAPTVVMCRSVLDTIFEESIPDPVVREHVPDRIKGSIVLANRIDAAEKAGRISRELAVVARKVKNAANDAVHNVPLTVLAPFEAVQGTIQIVELLTRSMPNVAADAADSG